MGRTGWWGAVVALAGMAVAGGGTAGDAQESLLQVELADRTEREAVVAGELRELTTRFDLRPWILTPRIRIEEGVIPHSHPILTLSTGSLGRPDELLATFVHEQLHWVEDRHPESWAQAISEYRRLYPDVPSSDEGGARDEESTYRHLLVCDMELQAVAALLGEERAREIFQGYRHYRWIYDRVLEDPEVRAVALRFGFDASAGAPEPG